MIINALFLVFVETKVQSTADSIILQKTYLNRIYVAEACGFSGGIWLLWDDTLLDLEVISINDQIITMAVKNCTLVKWMFSAIYASPKIAFRKDLWNYMTCLGAILGVP